MKNQIDWIRSMAFGIPLSTTNLDRLTANDVLIQKNHYNFTHKNKDYYQAMRAVIHQATRIDGNVCREKDIIGTLTDKTIQNEIEEKLFHWIF